MICWPVVFLYIYSDLIVIVITFLHQDLGISSCLVLPAALETAATVLDVRVGQVHDVGHVE